MMETFLLLIQLMMSSGEALNHEQEYDTIGECQYYQLYVITFWEQYDFPISTNLNDDNHAVCVLGKPEDLEQ